MNNIETHDKLVVIGVDIQNDFCPGGSLAVPEGDKIVPVFNRVANWARNQNGVVALTADWHPAETSHFSTWPVHCVANTEGAAFHPDLQVDEADRIYHKGMGATEDAYSGFDAITANGGTLEDLIRPYKETVAVVIGGLATDYCVKATALDAAEKAKGLRYVDVYVVEDAIAGVNIQPEDSQNAITEMKAAGITFVTAAEITGDRE